MVTCVRKYNKASVLNTIAYMCRLFQELYYYNYYKIRTMQYNYILAYTVIYVKT